MSAYDDTGPTDVAALVEEALNLDKERRTKWGTPTFYAGDESTWRGHALLLAAALAAQERDLAAAHDALNGHASTGMPLAKRIAAALGTHAHDLAELQRRLEEQAREVEALRAEVERAGRELDTAEAPTGDDDSPRVMPRSDDQGHPYKLHERIYWLAHARDEARLNMADEPQRLRARLAEVERERDAAGEKWPQTTRALLDALRTFSIGRAWLADMERAESERDAATAGAEKVNKAMLRVTDADTAIREHKAKCEVCQRLRQCAAAEALLLCEEEAIDALRALTAVVSRG